MDKTRTRMDVLIELRTAILCAVPDDSKLQKIDDLLTEFVEMEMGDKK